MKNRQVLPRKPKDFKLTPEIWIKCRKGFDGSRYIGIESCRLGYQDVRELKKTIDHLCRAYDWIRDGRKS